jgi:hypothetical protein
MLLLPKFKFKFCWEFALVPKRKVIPLEFIFHHEKFGICWCFRSTSFILCKFESFEYLENCLDVELGPTQCNSTGPLV